MTQQLEKKFKNAVVLGAGAFGTAMSSVLANNFERVYIKVRSLDVYTSLKSGSNDVYLKNKKIPGNVIPVVSWDELSSSLDGEIHLIVSALPSTAITEFLLENYEQMLTFLKHKIPVLSLSKGIDPVTLEMADDLYASFFPEFMDQFVFLSGPSFASEIMDGQITLVSIAGKSKKILESTSLMFETSYFKALPSYDVKGVLLGGALKNILAIAGGIVEGLGYNHNTKAAMITRGIAEMLRFGKIFNARPETFYGLSGMGDLILTITGELSRNKKFGIDIAKGLSAQDILKNKREVVEGYKTTKAAYKLAEKYDIHARIFNGVYCVVYENEAPAVVINKIMSAPTKFELE